MAPEQATDRAPTAASDWYSVGAILYEVLVGHPVFAGPSGEVLLRKSFVDPPAPSDLVTGVPADLDALCRALLRRVPGARPTGGEIVRMLGDLSPNSVPPALGSAPSLRPVARGRLIGRDAELRTLGDAFDAARRGRVVTVRLSGSAGVGKDALIQQFVGELVASGSATSLVGRAYERESMPYKALDSVIDALSRDLMQAGRSVRPSLALPRDVSSARLFPVPCAWERGPNPRSAGTRSASGGWATHAQAGGCRLRGDPRLVSRRRRRSSSASATRNGATSTAPGCCSTW